MDADYLELRQRALALVRLHTQVSQDDLLTHVYGAHVPPALRDRLLAPLLADPRLARSPDGTWTLVAEESRSSARYPFTALVVVATSARQSRSRVAGIAGLRLAGEEIVARFSQIVNPAQQVPGYVHQQIGVDGRDLDSFPFFEDIADGLVEFLAGGPVIATEARLAWQWLEREARRCGRSLPGCRLLDLGQLADACLRLGAKPTLGAIAQQVGVSPARLGHFDSDARTLAHVAVQLFKHAAAAELPWIASDAGPDALPLRTGATLGVAPDEPGVYVLRDVRGDAVYIGKARRIRTRLAAYINRPLGATRRLEGLAEVVHSVHPHACGSELEALIVEDRSIRALQPRFNTQRRSHAGRTWVRLPPPPAPTRGRRQPARRRLELSEGRQDDGGDYLGPFRNATEAAAARALGRSLFGLDELRRSPSDHGYTAALGDCWAFLHGATAGGIARARRGLSAASQARDYAAMRHWDRLLAEALAYDPAAQLLPADPREARYAVVRPGPTGVELFVVDRGVLVFQGARAGGEPVAFAAAALAATDALTELADGDVVRRWLGSQRPTARLLLLADDATAVGVVATAIAELSAADAALAGLRHARSTGNQDALELPASAGDDGI